MKNYSLDIIVDADKRIIATAPGGIGYQIEPVSGHSKHTVEIPEHLANNNGSEFHNVLAQLLHFENGVAKIRELYKKSN